MNPRAAWALALLAGCSTIETPGLGPMTRVCEGAACRDVPVAALRAEPLPDATAAPSAPPEALYRQGLAQLRGDGAPRELFAGLQSLRAAAQAGYLPAQRMVGRIYMTGLDTMGQDLAEARSWLATAAGRGDRQARTWLAELDRAVAREREAEARLREREAETVNVLAAALLAAALAPPPVVVYRGW